MTNPFDDVSHINYVRENINPLYKLDKSEALGYAVSMGASDSLRGIGQFFGKAGEKFGWDDVSERLKKQDEKLKQILEHPEYGKQATAAFLSSAIVADPVSYVPIVGWISKGKKAKNLSDLAKYGAISGGAVSSVGYTPENTETLFLDEDANFLDRKVTQGVVGTTLGGIIGGAGGAAVNTIQKARGKGSIFSKPKLGQQELDFDPPKTKKEIQDNIVKESIKEKYSYKDIIIQKYQDYAGTPIKNVIFNNPGESLGFVAGYNAHQDPNATYKQKIATGIIVAASIKGAKNFKYKDEAVKDIVGRGIIHDYGLSPDYIKLRQKLRINKNEIGSEFYDILSRAEKDLNSEQRKLLYNIMVGDIQAVEKLSPEALAINDEARKLITKYGQEFVDRGLLDVETFKRNVNTYLKRSYLKSPKNTNTRKYDNSKQIRLIGDELKPRGIEEKITKKAFENPTGVYQKEGWRIVEELKGNKVKVRRDYTKAERIEMGGIEDASYAIAETGRLFANDIATARFFDDLSNDTRFVIDKKTYKSLNNIDQNKFELLPTTKITGTKKFKYGSLAGKYIDKDVARDVKHIYGFSTVDYGRRFDALQNLWKKTKTAWNFGTHVGNTASNVMLLDFADTKKTYLLKAFKEMVLNKDSKIHKQAKLDGIFDVDFISRELTESRTEIERMLKSLQEEKFGTGIFDKSKQVLKFGKKYSLDKMEKLYQFEDQIFRMAVYMDRLDKGLNKTDAALDARKWFIDYDISAPVIKVLKRSLVPFISYTYRVTPLLAEAAALRPHKFAKWAAYGHVLNEGFAFLMKDRAGEDIDRLTMREEQTKKLFGEVPLIGEAMPYTNVRVPFNDSEGNALYFDTSRWIPGGDIFEQRESTVGVPFLPRPLQPSGLYFDFVSNYFFKRDPFTGQTLEELGIDEDDYLEITKHFLKRIPPNMPFIKGTFAYNKYQKAKSIKAGEVEGEQVVGSKYTTADTPLAAIAYGLGFKLRPQNAEVNKLVKEALYQNEYRKLESERKKIITDFDKYGTAKFPTVEERDKELLKIDEEILKLAAEFEIYLNKLSELESKQEREQRVTGGLVSGPKVSDTKENPADRVDPFTGEPYSDQMARLGLAEGGNTLQEYEKKLNELEDYIKKNRLVSKEARMSLLSGEGYNDPRFIKTTGNKLIDKYGMRPFPAEGSGKILSTKELGIEGEDSIINPHQVGMYNRSKDIIQYKDISGILPSQTPEATQIHEIVHRAANKSGWLDNFYKDKKLKEIAPKVSGKRGKQLTNVINEALSHSYDHTLTNKKINSDELKEEIKFRVSLFNIRDDYKDKVTQEIFESLPALQENFENYLKELDEL